MFAELESGWDEVFDVVKRATGAVVPFGSRISLVVKVDIRPRAKVNLMGSWGASKPRSIHR